MYDGKMYVSFTCSLLRGELTFAFYDNNVVDEMGQPKQKRLDFFVAMESSLSASLTNESPPILVL
jgi:hypothetical protein